MRRCDRYLKMKTHGKKIDFAIRVKESHHLSLNHIGNLVRIGNELKLKWCCFEGVARVPKGLPNAGFIHLIRFVARVGLFDFDFSLCIIFI